MSEIASLQEKKLKAWAANYAAIYDSEGEDAAGIYLLSDVGDDNTYEELAPYIRTELESLGYIF